MGNSSTGCVIREKTWTGEIMKKTFSQKKKEIQKFLQEKNNTQWVDKLENGKLTLTEMCDILKFLASRKRPVSLRFVVLSLVKLWSNVQSFEMKDSTLKDIETWTAEGYPDWFTTGLDNLKKSEQKIKEIIGARKDKIDAEANKLRFV